MQRTQDQFPVPADWLTAISNSRTRASKALPLTFTMYIYTGKMLIK